MAVVGQYLPNRAVKVSLMNWTWAWRSCTTDETASGAPGADRL
jgi:hypothetical protein